MFAFMAVLVLGAFTLASCGSDDDEPSAPTYHFKPQITFSTDNAATKQTIEWRLLTTYESIFASVEGDMTEAEGQAIWNQMLSIFNRDVAPIMQSAVKETGDYTISCTLTLLKDGKDFKHEKFIATKPNK